MNHKFSKSDHKTKSFERFSLSKALFKGQKNLKISIKTSTNEGKTFFFVSSQWRLVDRSCRAAPPPNICTAV